VFVAGSVHHDCSIVYQVDGRDGTTDELEQATDCGHFGEYFCHPLSGGTGVLRSPADRNCTGYWTAGPVC